MRARHGLIAVVVMAGCGGGSGGVDQPDADSTDAAIDAETCPPLVSAATKYISQYEIGRFDTDAFPDMLVHNGGDGAGNYIRFLRGRGDGRFDKLTPIDTQGNPVADIRAFQWHRFFVADVNEDQHADIVFGAQGAGSGSSIGVFTGNGDGTFTAGFTVSGTNAHVIGVRPINSDAHLDIVTLVPEGSEWAVRPYLGDGAGGFQSTTSYPVTGQATAFISGAVGDFNGDGKLDAVVGAPSGLYTYLGNGDGTFQTPALTYAMSYPAIWQVADFDESTRDDLIVSAGVGTSATHLLLAGTVTPFDQSGDHVLDGISEAASVGDLDGDGHLDMVGGIATTDGGIRISLGNGDGTFDAPRDLAFPMVYAGAVALGDVTSDGDTDVVYQVYPENGVHVLVHDCVP